MWSRNGLNRAAPAVPNASALYASTPHLFVYQHPDEDYDLPPPPPPESSSSRRSFSSNSSSSNGPITPEAIYYPDERIKEKEAIRRLSHLKLNSDHQQHHQPDDSVCSSNSSETSYSSSGMMMTMPVSGAGSAAGSHMLTELELLRVETFFRGNRTQIFVGKSLANL